MTATDYTVHNVEFDLLVLGWIFAVECSYYVNTEGGIEDLSFSHIDPVDLHLGDDYDGIGAPTKAEIASHVEGYYSDIIDATLEAIEEKRNEITIFD